LNKLFSKRQLYSKYQIAKSEVIFLIRGIYISATGMVAESIRTDTIANNLANVNTTGYKKDVAVNNSFAEMLIYRINDGERTPAIGNLGLGTIVDEIGVIYDQGVFNQTDNPLNAAIEGKGFFSVQTQNGIRYTRNGTFSLNSQGQLVTMEGNIVLGRNGPIQIDLESSSLSRIVIDSAGKISRAGGGITEELGELAMVSFADEQGLLKEGHNLYSAGNAIAEPFTGRVTQGYLEQSNTNVVSEMVHLISAYRAYEINSKAIQSQDELLGKAINEVGKV